MAQPHPPAQQRPSFSQPSQSFGHGFQQPNGRSQFGPQSPPNSMQFSSPSPQPQFSPSYSAQGPPTKRPRLSPDAPSPFSPSVNTPQAGSPVNGHMNGYLSQNTSRSSLMPPPQQPVIKKEGRDEDVNVFKSAGIDFEEESAGLTNFSQNSNGQQTFHSSQVSSDINNLNGLPSASSGAPGASQIEVSKEDREARDQQRRDWDESRHSQHELWDPFVYGATLNDRIKTWSHRNNLAEPQSGVLVNTQRNQPPPIVRVNGHEGATRVINQGQSILDTREKADRLNELVKLLSLSTKARMTGLIQAAARLALERQQHSQGRVPDDWKDVALVSISDGDEQQNESSPAASAGKKRSYSEANDETMSKSQLQAGPHPAISAFEKATSQDLKAENARQAKRRKRNEVTNAQESDGNVAAEADVLAAAAGDDGRKTTKKERKMAESKITEQQQHASTNEAARMATANLFGRFGSTKKKNYSWMTGGPSSKTSSAVATPTRSNSFAAPPKEKQPQSQKRPQMGHFDESSEAGIQARDLLLVLESDGRAARSYVKAASILDDAAKQHEN